MKHLELRDSFLIGHKQIDREHAHLIDLFNTCIDIANEGRDKQAFCDAFQEILDALERHIDHEEAIMRKLGYTEEDEDVHAQSMDLFRALAKDCKHPVSMKEILRQATGCFLEMILKSDLGLKSHLEQIGYRDG